MSYAGRAQLGNSSVAHGMIRVTWRYSAGRRATLEDPKLHYSHVWYLGGEDQKEGLKQLALSVGEYL